ncbi:MAG: YidC/Oxa1 family membrane protein insertase, partial [Patiriisocius sp.]
MEKSKFDLNSIIGFLLIGGILIWMLYLNKPSEEEILAEEAKIEAAAEALAEANKAKESTTLTEATEQMAIAPNDSVAMLQLSSKLGSFAYSGTTAGTTVVENDVLYLEVSNKG